MNMNDFDSIANDHALSTADLILEYLRDEHNMTTAPNDNDSAADIRKDLATLLRDEQEHHPCHDWIGEALHRRQECSDLLRHRGEYYDRACRAENMLARVLLQPDNEPLREGARLLIKELNPAQLIPSEGNTKVLDPEVGKWIVFYPSDPDAGVYVITSLAETLRIRGMDGVGPLMDDIECEVAACHELGDAVLPEKTITWGKVIPVEDGHA